MNDTPDLTLRLSTFLVRIDYRTTKEAKSTTFTVSAPDSYSALEMAGRKIRKRRGVYRVDGGAVLGHSTQPQAA